MKINCVIHVKKLGFLVPDVCDLQSVDMFVIYNMDQETLNMFRSFILNLTLNEA